MVYHTKNIFIRVIRFIPIKYFLVITLDLLIMSSAMLLSIILQNIVDASRISVRNPYYMFLKEMKYGLILQSIKKIKNIFRQDSAFINRLEGLDVNPNLTSRQLVEKIADELTSNVFSLLLKKSIEYLESYKVRMLISIKNSVEEEEKIGNLGLRSLGSSRDKIIST
jgi:hypothetical protein